MAVDVVDSVLGIVFHDKNRAARPVRAVAHQIDQAAEC
jgi:hypothetical protein